ncbi:MAG: hypothetical protein H5T24_06290 [Bacteroidales bacterium]|nr:hypothetical protein [Bacteroidales bacterium]
MKRYTILVSVILSLLVLQGCKPTQQSQSETTIQELATSPFSNGVPAQVVVIGGQEYKYPIIAIWVEDLSGNFIGTLYASQSISTGIFRYGVYDKGKWLPGERNRPAALPRWKNLTASNAPRVNQGADAFSGATPSGSFALKTMLPADIDEFKVYMEVNKPWDFNSYWHNNRFPGDEEYATSGQPALIYEALVSTNSPENRFYFKPVGHSNPSGANGEIIPDIATFTSALKIIEKAWIELSK